LLFSPRAYEKRHDAGAPTRDGSMRILVTGASGLLGRAVAKLALDRGHEVFAAYNQHPVALGIPVRIDLTGYDVVRRLVHELRPGAVIHAAAYTDVDGCEVNRDLAWGVNAEATRHLAEASSEAGSHLVFVSTDYVFDGERGLYGEEDEPNPVNYYGFTKLKGEEFVRRYARSWCVARASVIYGWGPPHKQNFATWLLSNLALGRSVRVATDQLASPTLNTNLASMLLEIAERGVTGVLHTAGATKVSRFEFALRLAEVFGLDANLIIPSRMDEIPWRARRPRDSSLSVAKASALLSNKPVALPQALEAMRRERPIP